MNLDASIQEFEKYYSKYLHENTNFTLNSIIELPFYDLSIVAEELITPYETVANKIGLILMKIKEKKDNNNFTARTDFSRYFEYTSSKIKTNHMVYQSIKNVFEQWQAVSQIVEADISTQIKKHELLLEKVDKQLNDFEQFNQFSSKYTIAESFYIENSGDPDLKVFAAEELESLFSEYDFLFSNESFERFITFRDTTSKHSAAKTEDSLYNIFDLIDENIEDIRSVIRKTDPLIIATLADKFIITQDKSKSEIESFLNTKVMDRDLKTQLKFTPSQKVQEAYAFADGSYAFKNKNGYHTIKNVDEFRNLINNIVESSIDYTLRKKPKVAQFFKSVYIESPVVYESVKVVIDTYLNNEAILKNIKFDFSKIEDKDFEAIDDLMYEKVQQYKIERYAQSILSNKYQHFLTAESLRTFQKLYESKVTESDLQKFVGKKLAAVKTPEAFELFIKKVSDQFSGFTINALSTKLTHHNIEAHVENDVVVFPVRTFSESSDLGSPSWCISRYSSYFNDYTSKGEKQYFIYDFSKDETDNESLIGITIAQDGKFRAKHLRNDDSAPTTPFLEKIKSDILRRNHDKFSLTDEMKVELGIQLTDVDDQSTRKRTIKAGI